MPELDETTDIELLPDYPIVTFGNGHTCRIKRIYKLGQNQYGRELKAIKLFRNDIFMRINNIPKSYLNENLLRVLVWSQFVYSFYPTCMTITKCYYWIIWQ